MIYSFKIDEKSLFHGIKNDAPKGHSATVHTPLNQAKHPSQRSETIYAFLRDYSSENITNLPSKLSDICLRKTTSRSDCKIVYFYKFNKIELDGNPLATDCSFAIYVKEEISPKIRNRNNELVDNTHLGRQTLHYRKDLSFSNDSFNIDNRRVLDTILETNGGFAFVVTGFDINTEKRTINFRTRIVGLKGVLLSSVFRNKKGVGSKMLINGFLDQIGILSATKETLTEVEREAFYKYLERLEKSRRENGLAGELFVYENLERILKIKSEVKKEHVSYNYPQSLYDIECIVNGRKYYIEVKSTGKEKKVFFMSRGERQFLNKYESDYLLVLVTNLKAKRKKCYTFPGKDIKNKCIMEQEIQDIKFTVIEPDK